MDKPKLPLNPVKDTAAQREARLEYVWYLISEGSTVDAACKAAGTQRQTYYRWLNQDPALMARHEAVQHDLHQKVAEVAKLCALKAIDDHRYQTSMIFYLKSKAGWNDGTGFTPGQQEMPSISFKKPRQVKTKETTEDVSN